MPRLFSHAPLSRALFPLARFALAGQRRTATFASLLLPLLFSLSAIQRVAAQELDEFRYVATPSQPLTATPGGPKRGDLYINAPVKIVERRGEWVKVELEGWMREGTLSTKKDMRQDYLLLVTDSLLEIESFSSKHVEVKEGVPEPRVYLTLRLKNNSGNNVFSWSGTLVASHKVGGKVIFREPVAQDTSNLAPGGVGEATFYWKPDELPYNPLHPENIDEISLELFRVKVNK